MKIQNITAIAALAISALIALPTQAKQPTTDDSTRPGVTAPDPDQTDRDRSFDEFIRSIDILLNKEQMESLWPDAKERLITLATDQQMSSFERWRATSLLANFPSSDAKAALNGLTSDENERVRAMAYYTLGTAFLRDGDDQLFALLKAGLNDPAERVRADVVRSLGWTDHQDAPALLQEIARGDDQTLRPIAERSAKRLLSR